MLIVVSDKATQAEFVTNHTPMEVIDLEGAASFDAAVGHARAQCGRINTRSIGRASYALGGLS